MDCALDAAILIIIIVLYCGNLPTDPSFQVSHNKIQCVCVSLSGVDLNENVGS